MEKHIATSPKQEADDNEVRPKGRRPRTSAERQITIKFLSKGRSPRRFFSTIRWQRTLRRMRTWQGNLLELRIRNETRFRGAFGHRAASFGLTAALPKLGQLPQARIHSCCSSSDHHHSVTHQFSSTGARARYCCSYVARRGASISGTAERVDN